MGFILRQIEKTYKGILFRRHDPDESIFCFSHIDYDGLNAEEFSFVSKRATFYERSELLSCANSEIRASAVSVEGRKTLAEGIDKSSTLCYTRLAGIPIRYEPQSSYPCQPRVSAARILAFAAAA